MVHYCNTTISLQNTEVCLADGSTVPELLVVDKVHYIASLCN